MKYYRVVDLTTKQELAIFSNKVKALKGLEFFKNSSFRTDHRIILEEL